MGCGYGLHAESALTANVSFSLQMLDTKGTHTTSGFAYIGMLSHALQDQNRKCWFNADVCLCQRTGMRERKLYCGKEDRSVCKVCG